ncbi:hypothetical protein BU23DRAFT_563380 [Bimuria novae-zelandiae CBS 107.79]|uniref:Uncharacterized protein n=1 Tax=Bimuria novae-zelandiae CBS 107.79 TaxID=1447943 RepID=A0A6A5VRF0_9PLEO|nr:hypothetical protein BU23DRAFT_563380 [Bimuria novae-zelandiae CBS 107.79]
MNIYLPSAVSLPIPDDPAVVDPKLLNQADQACTAKLGGYRVDDRSPAVQRAFAELWDKTGLKCQPINAMQLVAEVLPLFAMFLALEILGWPSFGELASTTASTKSKEISKLTVDAGKEIARLGMHGEIGKKVAEFMTEEGWVGALFGAEQACRPCDLVAFCRYHHGDKVLEQNMDILRECLKVVQGEGKGMEAFTNLIPRVEEARRT